MSSFFADSFVWFIGLLSVRWIYKAIRNHYKAHVPMFGDTVSFIPEKNGERFQGDQRMWGIYVDKERAIRRMNGKDPKRQETGDVIKGYYMSKGTCHSCRAVLIEKQVFIFNFSR